MRTLLIIITLSLNACLQKTDKKVLHVDRDDKGRILKEVSEGYLYGEGSFRRTTYFDTLGRQIKILEVKDNNKTVEVFIYSDSSTFQHIYYDLGHTGSYLDTNFAVSDSSKTFVRHIRLDKKGSEIYSFTKWFDDTIYCQEAWYDSTGRQLSLKETNCR